jgi:hypothetical protein
MSNLIPFEFENQALRVNMDRAQRVNHVNPTVAEQMREVA